LPPCDRAISRIHCKIQLTGFKTNKPVPDSFLVFLMLKHKKSHKISFWSKLPNQFFHSIWEFIQPERKFTIVDIGSVYGTYLKIRTNKEHPIEKG
jgi:hypothetical protein